MCVCVYVRTYVCMYLCMYVYILLLLLLLCKYTVNVTEYISFNATCLDVLEMVPAKHEGETQLEY